MDDQFNKNEIERLKQLLRALDASPASHPITPWWQDMDVKNFLGISQRTLERRRAERKIKSHKVGGRCYYLPENILDLKNEFLK